MGFSCSRGVSSSLVRFARDSGASCRIRIGVVANAMYATHDDDDDDDTHRDRTQKRANGTVGRSKDKAPAPAPRRRTSAHRKLSRLADDERARGVFDVRGSARGGGARG